MFRQSSLPRSSSSGIQISFYGHPRSYRCAPRFPYGGCPGRLQHGGDVGWRAGGEGLAAVESFELLEECR